MIASTARALLPLMRPTTSSAWAPTALRANSAASARRVATRSPCASIASTTEFCEVWIRSIRLSPRSPRRESRLSPTALRRLSTSPTRDTMSPAAFWLVLARRSARLSPTASIETLIRAPSATMRSTVEEPVRSIATVISSDAALRDAVIFWPASVSRSLKLPPALTRSWATLS